MFTLNLELDILENVKVELTERGKYIWRNYWNNVPNIGQNYIDQNVIERPLFQIMEIFGPHMKLGLDTPFRTIIVPIPIHN